MKSTVIICLCLLSILALVEYSRAEDGYQLCDSWGCSLDCYEQGLHGECDQYDTCQCSYCIYKACRRYCIRQNQVGQCDEKECVCL